MICAMQLYSPLEQAVKQSNKRGVGGVEPRARRRTQVERLWQLAILEECADPQSTRDVRVL